MVMRDLSETSQPVVFVDSDISWVKQADFASASTGDSDVNNRAKKSPGNDDYSFDTSLGRRGTI